MKATKPVSGYLVERGGYYHTVINAYVDGKRKPISRTTGLPVKNNLRRAQKILEERKEKYDREGLSGMLMMEERQKENSMLFSEYLVKFIDRKKNSLSPETYNDYISKANGRIKRFFDPRGVTVSTMTPRHIEDFLDSILDDGCGGTTQLAYYQIINACLKNAVRRDHIDRNPAEKVDRPKRDKYVAAYFTHDEALRLLECAKNDSCYIPILFGVYYGMRRSEALGVLWSSIDFENNTICINHTVHQKSENHKGVAEISDRMKSDSSRRTLPLIPVLREALLEHKKKQEEYRKSFRSEYCKEWLDCVCVRPTGELIKPKYLTEHFRRLLDNNGFSPNTHFHTTRHTCASLLVSQGMSMKQIQLWLGHSTFSTTADIYAHLSTDALNEPANCIANLLSEPQKKPEAE